MTMESDIHAALASVGATYPGGLPANPPLPSTSYKFISGVPARHHGGNSMVRRRLQVDCWAKTYTAAVTLSYSVISALDLNVTNFELITLENPGTDLPDPEPGIQHKMLEFFVWE
jgi:hypothetical protein